LRDTKINLNLYRRKNLYKMLKLQKTYKFVDRILYLKINNNDFPETLLTALVHRLFSFNVTTKAIFWELTLIHASTCFSCSPPDLNLVVTFFKFRMHVK